MKKIEGKIEGVLAENVKKIINVKKNTYIVMKNQ
jgi:hypothetical protein